MTWPTCAYRGLSAPPTMLRTLGTRPSLEAELVAFEVVHDRPRSNRFIEALATRCAEPDEAIGFSFDCCLPFRRLHRSIGDNHVEMAAVLRRLALRDLLNEDARAGSIGVYDRRELISVFLWNSDCVGECLPGVETLRGWLQYVAEGFGPERGERPRVLRVEGDLK